MLVRILLRIQLVEFPLFRLHSSGEYILSIMNRNKINVLVALNFRP